MYISIVCFVYFFVLSTFVVNKRYIYYFSLSISYRSLALLMLLFSISDLMYLYKKERTNIHEICISAVITIPYFTFSLKWKLKILRSFQTNSSYECEHKISLSNPNQYRSILNCSQLIEVIRRHLLTPSSAPDNCCRIIFRCCSCTQQ